MRNSLVKNLGKLWKDRKVAKVQNKDYDVKKLFMFKAVLDCFLCCPILLMSFTVMLSKNAAGQKESSLHYTFAKKDKTSIVVTVRFVNNRESTMPLLLPGEWAGQDSLYKCISNIKAVTEQTGIASTNRPDSFIVKTIKGKETVIEYTLQQDWDGVIAYPIYFRPIITDSIFFISGNAGLVYPVLSDTVLNCSITYKNFSSADYYGNSFFVNKTSGSFKATIANLKNAVYFAGNMRAKDFFIQGSKITVVMAGNYTFDSDSLYAVTTKIIAAERKFWKDTAHPPFVITILPVTSATSGGTAYHNSFAVFYNPKFKINQGLQYLLAHEYFHTWLGQKMQQSQPEEAGKWFIEGFTDYYTYITLKDLGLISEQEYLNAVNDVFIKYYRSNFSDADNAVIQAKYFTDGQVKQLAYNRGHIIAILINGILQKQQTGETLDDCVRNFYTGAKNPRIFSDTAFFRQLLHYAGESTMKLVQEILNGNNERIVTNLYSREYHIDSIQLTLFEMGFDFAESRKQKKVVGLIAGSAAEQAGLENGLPLTGSFSFSNGTPDRLAKIGVIKNNINTVLEYYPARKVNRYAPRFKMKLKT